MDLSEDVKGLTPPDAREVALRAGVGTAQVAIRGHPPGYASEILRYARCNREGAVCAGGHIGPVELRWDKVVFGRKTLGGLR